jgi:hypothetical protein
MALYSRGRDMNFKLLVNRSFINAKVSTEVIYYKLSLGDTQYDIYGESKKKMYKSPVLTTCMVERLPQVATEEMYGTDSTRNINFNFLKADLEILNLLPEKGDIIVWNESYFEVGNVVEDQLLGGKDPNYALEPTLNEFGLSLSMICECHQINVNKLNIIQSR